jgi:RNA polymerase II C-terminal domain phosphatase-like 3/4
MQELRLGTSEIDRLRDADLKNLLRGRKLVLILDLDHTLINSTRLQDISSTENELGIPTIASKGNAIHLFYKLLKFLGIEKKHSFPFGHDYKILPLVQTATMWL